MTQAPIDRTPDRPSRLRVAVIYPFFAHYRAAIVRELSARGAHEYHFIADARDPMRRIECMTFARSERFIETRTWHLTERILWQQGVLKAAARGPYDCYIFLGNAAWPTTWLGALLARARGRRVFFWTHGWNRPEYGLKQRWRRTFYGLANGLLLYGDYARRLAIAAGIDAKRLHVIFNSLDFAEQRACAARIDVSVAALLRERLFGCADRPIVLATARLTRGKRFDLLLAAVAHLRADGKQIGLLIIGDGPARAELEAQAAQAQLNAVFVGACYEERRLAELFSIATVCVSPGNVGLTCMHSLGYGVPVITHDDPHEQNPEWEAIVPGVTGDLFTKNDGHALARVIDAWTQDPWPTAQTRAQCIELVHNNYSPARQRELIEQALTACDADQSLSTGRPSACNTS
jgi:glycosyltransferase involved in cell wall biosynthesis